MTPLPAPVERTSHTFTLKGIVYEYEPEGWDEPTDIWRAHRRNDSSIYGYGETPEEAEDNLWKRADADYFENLDYGSPRLPPSMRSGW